MDVLYDNPTSDWRFIGGTEHPIAGVARLDVLFDNPLSDCYSSKFFIRKRAEKINHSPGLDGDGAPV